MAIKKENIKVEKQEKPQEEKNKKPPRKKRVAKTNTKQKRLAKILEEEVANNGGKLTKGKLLEKAGYGKSSQKNPKKILTTHSLVELLTNQGFDIETLKKIHAPIFASANIMYVEVGKGGDEDVVREAYERIFPELTYIRTYTDSWGNLKLEFRRPDNATILKALEIGYKILGAYAPDKIALTDTDGNNPITSVSINIIKNDKDSEHSSE